MITSPLLINESPLLVLPSLAVAVGLEQAIVLQQIQFWVGRGCGIEHEGRRWIHNTIDEWAEQFPFIQRRTLVRVFQDLRDRGLIEVRRLDPNPWVRTNHYAINYEGLNALVEAPETGTIDSAKMASSIVPNCHNGECQTGTIIPTETTHRLTSLSSKGSVQKEELPPPSKPARKRSPKKPSEAVVALLRAYRTAVYGPASAEPTASDVDAYTERLNKAVAAGVTPEQFEAATRAALDRWSPSYITPRSIANNLPTLLANTPSVQLYYTDGIQNEGQPTNDKRPRPTTHGRPAPRVAGPAPQPGTAGHQPSATHQPSETALALAQLTAG